MDKLLEGRHGWTKLSSKMKSDHLITRMELGKSTDKLIVSRDCKSMTLNRMSRTLIVYARENSSENIENPHEKKIRSRVCEASSALRASKIHSCWVPTSSYLRSNCPFYQRLLLYADVTFEHGPIPITFATPYCSLSREEIHDNGPQVLVTRPKEVVRSHSTSHNDCPSGQVATDSH